MKLPTTTSTYSLFITVYFAGKRSIQTVLITCLLVNVKIGECLGPYCDSVNSEHSKRCCLSLIHWYFLARDSVYVIARYAIARPSVRPSVTRVDQGHT